MNNGCKKYNSIFKNVDINNLPINIYLKGNSYELYNKSEILHCISKGFFVIFKFNVYKYFKSKEMGIESILRVPALTEKKFGEHVSIFVGYDLTKSLFTVHNIFKNKWFNSDYFFMPFEYVDLGLTIDHWVVRK